MVGRGWVLRNAIVWHKPSAMPSSVRDRFANTYEFVFFFAPGERYWFDLDAVREPFKVGPAKFNYRVRDAAAGRLDAKFGGLYAARPEELARYEEVLTRPGHVEVVRGPTRVKTAPEDAFRTGPMMRQAPEPGEAHAFHPLGRNPGDVWSIASEPFPEAHFATYPTALCERVVLAGCPPKVCAACGAPWRRTVMRGRVPDRLGRIQGRSGDRLADAHGPDGRARSRFSSVTLPLGWEPTCGCGAGWRPGVVLDPFAGSGTTLLVAQRLGRDAVGIELKPEYLEMARRRVGREHRQQRLPVGIG
jgi:site-specific DNA-methyltransferase (adenine-specific)